MSWQQRVVWTEGMFLRPQHFQQQERYLEFYANARSAAAGSHAWGFEELVLDADALKLGKLAIQAARGVFPDGTPFSIPAQGEPPSPLDVPSEARDQRVMLALPIRRPDVAEVTLAQADGDLTRVRVNEREVVDAIAMGSPSALVQLGDLRLRLLVESDLVDGWMALGVARIVDRRPDNSVQVDPAYMPPTLSLRACPPLTAFMRELQGLLHQRGEALAGHMTQAGRGGISEMADFMLLQVVNRWEPRVRHLLQQNALHAERLYAMLLELGGDLATFARESRRPIEYPVYDHDDPQKAFQPLMDDLRRSMSLTPGQNAIPIDLEHKGHSVYVGVMPSIEIVRTASFVLAVSADVPADMIRTRFPMQTKIGPVEKIRELVMLHLPGIPLRPLPVAPRAIPYNAGFNYFELDTKHELWQRMPQSGGIAMHIAGDFPGLQFQFWAIRP